MASVYGAGRAAAAGAMSLGMDASPLPPRLGRWRTVRSSIWGCGDGAVPMRWRRGSVVKERSWAWSPRGMRQQANSGRRWPCCSDGGGEGGVGAVWPTGRCRGVGIAVVHHVGRPGGVRGRLRRVVPTGWSIMLRGTFESTCPLIPLGPVLSQAIAASPPAVPDAGGHHRRVRWAAGLHRRAHDIRLGPDHRPGALGAGGHRVCSLRARPHPSISTIYRFRVLAGPPRSRGRG